MSPTIGRQWGEVVLTLQQLFRSHGITTYQLQPSLRAVEAFYSPGETAQLLSTFFDIPLCDMETLDRVPDGSASIVLSATSNFLNLCRDGFDFLTLFQPEDRLKIIGGAAHLVLLSIFETFPEAFLLNDKPCLGDYLTKISRRYSLRSSHFHVALPDLEFRQNYSKWRAARGYKSMFSPHAINSFEKDAFNRTPSHELKSIVPYSLRKFQKAYLCLCARPHPQRLSVFHYLTENELLGDGYFSFLCRDHQSRIGADAREISRLSHWRAGQDRFDKFQRFLDTAPHGLMEEQRVGDIWDRVDSQSPVAAIHQSVFQLVLETDADAENSLFLTEKTFKPLLFQQPFLVFGHPGTLRFLRSCGYETFPELFDESYDLELDNHKRFDLIMKNVKRLCHLGMENLSRRASAPELVRKLEHNARLFQERSKRPIYMD